LGQGRGIQSFGTSIRLELLLGSANIVGSSHCCYRYVCGLYMSWQIPARSPLPLRKEPYKVLINRGNLFEQDASSLGGSISPALIRSKRMARTDTIFASYSLVLQCVPHLSIAQMSASSLDIVL